MTEYTYDAASRVTGVAYRRDTTTLGTLSYMYDAAGHRLRVGGTWARTGLPPALESSSYDAANRQLTFGAQVLTYDLNGNLLSDGTSGYTWDARNRLTGITGPVTATFQYDATGRRTRKTINAVTTDFVHDGINPVTESSASGTGFLLTGLGVDDFLMRLGPGSTAMFLTDALGSLVATTDAAGGVQSELTYEPFGATEISSPSPAYRFTGREHDEPTLLYYYRARYYHADLQRFISDDPIEFAGGDINLYAYVHSSPVQYRDPLGWWGAGGVVGGNAEVGLPGFPGAAAQLSYGWGLFGGGCHGIRDEVFATVGGFVTPMTIGERIAVGAYAGYGGGFFFTNATDVSQIGGAGDTWTLDLSAGPLPIKGSLSLSLSAKGIFTFSATAGWGYGYGVSRTQTTTGHASVPECPKQSKSSR